MVTGEQASFFCSEWMRSSDPYDYELDAEAEGAQVGKGAQVGWGAQVGGWQPYLDPRKGGS